MIGLTQVLQSNRNTYSNANASSAYVVKSYSDYAPSQSSTSPLKKSFAHTVRDLRSETAPKAENVNGKRTRGGEHTQAREVKVQERAEKSGEQVRDVKMSAKESKKRGEGIKGSLKKGRHGKSYAMLVKSKQGDEETASEEVAASEKFSMSKDLKDMRRGTRDVLRSDGVKDAEKVEHSETEFSEDDHAVSHRWEASESFFVAENVEHEKLSANFVQEVQERVIQPEGGKSFGNERFLEGAERIVRREDSQKADLLKTGDTSIVEEFSESTLHEKFLRDEEGEKSSNAQLRVKGEDAKNTKAMVRLDIDRFDDNGQKSAAVRSLFDSSFNTSHEKPNNARISVTPIFEKKALSYLEQQGNQRLVQDAKFVFRENSMGNIRLQLNPRELGEVKLMVKLDDNNLVHAHAIVSSEDAKDVMQKNLGNLAKQFGNEGYEIGGFSVSVNTEPSDTNDGRDQLFDKRTGHHERGFVEQIEENMRSYVRMSQSVDFVA